MARYIDADELILNIKRFARLGTGWIHPDIVNYLCSEMIHIVKDQKSCDVNPAVHAKWKDNGANYECSNCGHTEARYGMLYCPRCGAKMDEGVE